MSGIELSPFHDWLVELRRAFHRNPELSYGEVQTSRKIAEVLRELGVEVRTGIAGTGIVARIDFAYSTEGVGVQMMVAQPFQF